MPCYQQNLISVDLKTADKAVLEDAIKALGLTFTNNTDGSITIQTNSGPITLKDGVAQFYNNGCQTWVNKIKQSYSLKGIQKLSAKYKLNIVNKPNGQMILRRY